MDAQNLRKTPLMSRWESEQFDFSFENLILRVHSCLLQYVELRKMIVNKMVPTVSFGGSYSSWVHSHWPQSSAQNEFETFVVEFCMCECVYNNLLQILYQNWHRQHIVILERNIIRWETTLSKQNQNNQCTESSITQHQAPSFREYLRHSDQGQGCLERYTQLLGLKVWDPSPAGLQWPGPDLYLLPWFLCCPPRHGWKKST